MNSVIVLSNLALFFDDSELSMSFPCAFCEEDSPEQRRTDQARRKPKRREQRGKPGGARNAQSGGKRFFSVEHYMYYAKALVSNDMPAVLSLLDGAVAEDAERVRQIGRGIKCDERVWSDSRFHVVYQACLMKFSRAGRPRSVLLSDELEGKTLVFCTADPSLVEEEWGIDLSREAVSVMEEELRRRGPVDDEEEGDWRTALEEHVLNILQKEEEGQSGEEGRSASRMNKLGRVLEKTRHELKKSEKYNYSIYSFFAIDKK